MTVALSPASEISILDTPVTCGRFSISANSGPTCPVSASTLLIPQKIISKASRANAKDSARAVANVSEPANALSLR